MVARARPTAVSVAAISVLETLILELGARKIVESDALIDVLEDAAMSHDQIAAEEGEEAFVHLEAAMLIRRISSQLRYLSS